MNCVIIGMAVLALSQADLILAPAGEAALIVRESADALGGQERIAAASSISFGVQGEAYFPYQGPTPEEPGVFNYGVSAVLSFDPLSMQVTSGFTGGETAFMRTMDFDGDSVSSQAEFARQLRQSPHALIREWLAAPQTLILTGQTSTHHVVSGAFHGRLAHAHINRESGLVDRIAVPFNDVRHGDALALAEFMEYRDSEGWKIPGRLRLVEAGNVIFDLQFDHYAVSMEKGVESARQPDTEQDSEAQGGGPDSPPATFEQPSVETFLHREYADGVRMLFNTGGPDYHSLAVATNDGVMVIETPGSVASGKRLIDRAGELGAVKYIAATHHHGDHSGGVAGAASSDRTVVVAAWHRAFFEDLITAERRFLTFEFSPVDEPAFATIPARGETTVGGRVVAYDAGPTGHSDAQLVFYVPDAKLLYQSDMAVFRWDGSVEPARTQTCRLRAFIREQELEVEVIAGGHGRPGSLVDLDRAIAQRGEGCAGATIE